MSSRLLLPHAIFVMSRGSLHGVRWNVLQDQLIISLDALTKIATQVSSAKRNVVIGQFYDPLGFLSPVTIQFKNLRQKVCKAKLGWDQALKGDLLNEWNKLVRDFESGQDKRTIYRLYGFCDTSSTVYGLCSSGDLVKENGGHKGSTFVTLKTGVAPLKPLTILKLELLSKVFLAHLVVTISDSLSTQMELKGLRRFTDAQVLLFWIKGTEKDWRPFVQNRVDSDG